MKKRNIMATSSIAVALFLSSYATSQAASYPLIRPRIYAETQNLTVLEPESEDLAIQAGDFREELGLDPTFGDSLVKQGFSPSQIQNIFTSASLKNDYDRLPLEE